jgi:hypothetical protein
MCFVELFLNHLHSEWSKLFTGTWKNILLVEMFHIVDFNDQIQSFQVTRRRDNFHQLLFFNELLDHKVFQLHNPVDLSVSKNQIYAASDFIATKSEINFQ